MSNLESLVLNFSSRSDAIYSLNKKIATISGAGWNKNEALRFEFENLKKLLEEVREISSQEWDQRVHGANSVIVKETDENGLPIFKFVYKGFLRRVKISAPPFAPILTFVVFLSFFFCGVVSFLLFF